MVNIPLFNNLVRDKSVAFVGLAPNISGKGLGAEIDSFDVVIRTYFPVKTLFRDYGKRTDIVALNNPSLESIKTFDKTGLSGLITYKRINNDMKSGLEYYLIPDSDRIIINAHIKKTINKDPMMATNGLNILYYCLEHNCSRFKMFGITGYQNKDGVIENFKNSKRSNHYVINIDGTDYLKDDKSVNGVYHNYDAGNDFLRLLLKQNKIEMDTYSLEYFT